jgi:hypothetical protein
MGLRSCKDPRHVILGLNSEVKVVFADSMQHHPNLLDPERLQRGRPQTEPVSRGNVFINYWVYRISHI